MAKHSLIGGSIWEEYSQKVQDLMNNPRNMGQLTEEDAEKPQAQADDCRYFQIQDPLYPSL